MTQETPAGLELSYLIVESCAVRSPDYTGLHDRDEFNAAAGHVRDLVAEAIILLRAGAHARSLFLTITAFEELAKIKVGHFRSRGGPSLDVKRSKDPLFNHASKHKIAFDPVLLIGQRLAHSIEADRVREIFSLYANGAYSALRERSLYFSRGTDGLKLPSNEVTLTLAAEHVLIAIEAFDDFFDFMTQEVSAMCKQLMGVYPEVEDLYRRSLPSRPSGVAGADRP
jgi:AbiV family abortive infection protein